MTDEEKKDNENRFADRFWDKSCFSGRGIPEAMVKCCRGMSGSGDFRSMMARCMKMFRWFPLIPVMFGIVLLLLGYCLDAEITRIILMIAAGFMILMGIFGFLMMRLGKRTCC